MYPKSEGGARVLIVDDDDVVRFLAPALHANRALDDEQPLRPRVGVPVRASARRELDAVDVDRSALGVRCEQLRPRGAEERARVGRPRLGVGTPEDLHGALLMIRGAPHLCCALSVVARMIHI